MLLKYYPEYFKDIPWNRYNLPIKGRIYKNNKNNINDLLEKIDNSKFLSSKWKKSIKKRLNIYNMFYKRTFHVFQKELSSDKNLEFVKEKYINDNSLLKKYVNNDSWKEIIDFVDKKRSWKIALVLTAEFYLRLLKKRNFL